MTAGRRAVGSAIIVAGLAALMFALAQSVWRAPAKQVTVYAALDQEFSAPLFTRFTEQTGIAVQAKYDTEATKSVGLANAILAEADRPRADVFWNNEILNTIRLDRAGLLDRFDLPIAGQLSSSFVSPDRTWYGFAARARVLLVNRTIVPPDQQPRSITALADSQWRGRVGIAKPLFGTTATHAACLFAAWGPERARDFFRRLRANDVQILAGNKHVATAVASGQLAFGLTDTDDAAVVIDSGAEVDVVFPDQASDELGTLLIPNTLAVIKGSARQAEAAKLIEFLISPQVESILAQGPSAQIPLLHSTEATPRLPPPAGVRWMEVDWNAAADQWAEAARYLRDEFLNEP